MSYKPRNKRIAGLLAGASLSALSLVSGARSAAAQTTVLITGVNPTVVINAPPTGLDRIIVAGTVNGDVVNNVTVGSTPNPVLFTTNAVITGTSTTTIHGHVHTGAVGAFINNGTITAHDTDPDVALAAGILDLAPGVPLIQNNGVIEAEANASGGNFAAAGAGGVVQAVLGSGAPVFDTVVNTGTIDADANAEIENSDDGFAFAGAGGVLQGQFFVPSGHQTVSNQGGIITADASADVDATDEAEAIAIGLGVGQAVIFAGSADQAVINGSPEDTHDPNHPVHAVGGQITGHGFAEAEGTDGGRGATDADAIAVGLGVGQAALLVGNSNQLVDNHGSITGYASAYAFAAQSESGAEAEAIAIGGGVVQVAALVNGPAVQDVNNAGDIRGSAYASASAINGEAFALAAGVGVGQVVIGADSSSQTINNSGSLIVSNAEAHAYDEPGKRYVPAVAVALDAGSFQVAALVGTAYQSVTNGTHATISGNALAVASGTANATAIAAAVGAGQAALFVGQSQQVIDNDGLISAQATATADVFFGPGAEGTDANAIALAFGAPQIGVAFGSAYATLANQGTINASANAFASAGDDIGDNAFALAGAFGADQVVVSLLGGNAIAALTNTGQINATADAFAGGYTATAVGIANGAGQVAIAFNGSANASLVNGSSHAPHAAIIADANATAYATGDSGDALAVAAANGAGQLVVAPGSAAATIGNAGLIQASAYALAANPFDDATAIALANGAGQVVLAGSAANASGVNHNIGTISANATAAAFAGGDDDTALAIAAAGGFDQVVVAGGSANAAVDNNGQINANAFAGASGSEATAIGLANGVGQLAISTESNANAAFTNFDSGAVNAVAVATAYGGGAAPALAIAAANGVGQLVVADDVASATINNAGLIAATAYAFASNETEEAIAVALANGAGQVVIGGSAFASGVNHNVGTINAHAQATAFGSNDDGVAIAAAGGFDQVVVAGGSAYAAVDNNGHIGAQGSAYAVGTDAFAIAAANGVGQLAISTESNANAAFTNHDHGVVSAYASAAAFASDDTALAIAAANGVGQAVLADFVASATINNSGAIQATANAFAVNTSEEAIAVALANGAGQIAVGTAAFVAATNQGHIDANANAAAFGGQDGIAFAAAGGLDQVALASQTASAAAANGGHIGASASAYAVGTDAFAIGLANGVGQLAISTDYNARAVYTGYHGDVNAHADASALGSDDIALAVAAANGVGQLVVADDGVASATVNNNGLVQASAHAFASNYGTAAVAVGLANGVGQVAAANTAAFVSATNGGTINASATAAAFATTFAFALAAAGGLDQVALARGPASAVVFNSGHINAQATAYAAAFSTAIAVGLANGVGQLAISTDYIASASVNNHGGAIDAAAKATAFAFFDAEAFAAANGVGQAAIAPLAAFATVNNSGHINAQATAYAGAISDADAAAFANGVGQFVLAGGAAVASVHNSGFIGAQANATAYAFGDADAIAVAQGVGQLLIGPSTATATVINSGTISAHAVANAIASSASAFANAQGVNVLAFGVNNLNYHIANSGLIQAQAFASAFGGTAFARATGIFVGTTGTKVGSIFNSGNIFATAIATGSPGVAGAVGIWDPSQSNDGEITNTGLIHAYAQASIVTAATGILITGIEKMAPCEQQGAVACEAEIEVAELDLVLLDGITTITNNSGTIWAGFSEDGGHTVHRGNAINVYDAPNDVVINLQGENGPGHIYGDIYLHDNDYGYFNDTINVTNGTTFFDGVIRSGLDVLDLNGTLNIFDGGKLVLCQEGWLGACDPNGWGDANYDPQQGVDGPSFVFIDTLNVGHDGTLAYQLTPLSHSGQYPQVFANEANLGGTLAAQYLPGFYADHTFYDNIIQANGGFGVFDTVTDNSLLLKTVAIYENFNVDLNVTRTAFNEVNGLSKNQKAAAGGIENVFGKLPGPDVNPATTGPFAQMVASLFTIDNAKDYQLVLDQLSGAQFAQLLQSQLYSLRPLNASITDRMDCDLSVTEVAANTMRPGYAPCIRPGQVQAWARAFGGWNNLSGDTEAPGFSEDQFGVWAGLDYGWGAWFVGVAGGWFDSNVSFDQFGGVNGGSVDYDGGQIALYGGWDSGVWYDRAIVSGGFYDGESHRFISIQSSPLDPNGSPDTDAVSFYNEFGRRFGGAVNGVGWAGSTWTPFFGFGVASAELDGFTESDPQNTGAALNVGSSDGDSVYTALGLRYNGRWGGFRPQVAVSWEHEFEDTFQTVNMSFAGAPSGSNFKVVGTELGEDAVVLDAGGSYLVGVSSDISFRYIGRWLEDYDSQSIMGRFTWRWGGAPVAAPVPVAAEPLKLGSSD